MQKSKTAATTIMAPGIGPSDLGPVDAAIQRQRKLIAEYRSLRASAMSAVPLQGSC